MKAMRFTKMDGAGNDFVVAADVPENTVPRTPEMIRAVCDRRRGIGADGLLVLKPLAPGEVKMTYFNSVPVRRCVETACAAAWNSPRSTASRIRTPCFTPMRAGSKRGVLSRS